MRFEPRRNGAAFAWVLVLVFGALAVPGTYGLLADGGVGGALWVSLRLVALAYVADRLLVRTALEVELDGEVLAWRAPLASGQVPLREVRAFRGARLLSQWQVFELEGRRPVYVEAMRGIGALADALQAAGPDVDVRLGSRARRLERRPKPARTPRGGRRAASSGGGDAAPADDPRPAGPSDRA